MRYFVNEACIGCGACVSTCPAVFAMTERGVAAAAEHDVPPEELENAAEAMEGCPVEAIEEVIG